MSAKKTVPLLNAEEGEVLKTLEQQLMELCMCRYGDAASVYCQAMHIIQLPGGKNHLHSMAALVAEASLDAVQGHLGLRKYLAVFSHELQRFLKALEQAQTQSAEIPKEKMDAMWAELTERLNESKQGGAAETFQGSPHWS
ncbi:MAG: hypothetical protein FWG75_07495 [Cystobacterineae bacterium]|nr:hypothetical protein [Cystobacterineae bacterium]